MYNVPIAFIHLNNCNMRRNVEKLQGKAKSKVYKFYKELHQIKHKKSRETCGEEREKQRGGMEEEGWVQAMEIGT